VAHAEEAAVGFFVVGFVLLAGGEEGGLVCSFLTG
jgi:hypothetical protein